jgi:hypothetical protein
MGQKYQTGGSEAATPQQRIPQTQIAAQRHNYANEFEIFVGRDALLSQPVPGLTVLSEIAGIKIIHPLALLGNAALNAVVKSLFDESDDSDVRSFCRSMFAFALRGKKVRRLPNVAWINVCYRHRWLSKSLRSWIRIHLPLWPAIFSASAMSCRS